MEEKVIHRTSWKQWFWMTQTALGLSWTGAVFYRYIGSMLIYYKIFGLKSLPYLELVIWGG